MDRIRFELHQGKRILVMDMTAVAADAYPDVLARATALIQREAPGSVRLASVVKEARFGVKIAEHVKAFSAAIRPHLKASAIVGLSPLHQVIFLTVKPFLHGTITSFPSLAPAKDWLAKFP